MRAVLISIILLLGPWLLAEAAGNKTPIISGRVLDYRFKGDKPVGIPGVAVDALNSKDAIIYETLTDASGAFTLLGVDAKLVTLRFQKIGYRKNPTFINWPTSPDPVYLMRASADNSYFHNLGKGITQSAKKRGIAKSLAGALLGHIAGKVRNPVDKVEDKDFDRILRQEGEYEYRFFRSLGPTLEQRKMVLESLAEDIPQSMWIELDISITAEELKYLDSASATKLAKENELLRDVKFDPKSPDVSLPESTALESSIILLANASSFSLLITGYADDEEDLTRNNTLANIRAMAVRNYFVNRGIESSRFVIKSFGKEKPSCSIIEIACKSRSKKVEMALIRKQEIGTLTDGGGEQ